MISTSSFKEEHISLQPALILLQKLGYVYLDPEQVLNLRGGKTSNVLLEDILRRQLSEINSIKISSTKTDIFSAANIENGINALKDLPMQDGYIAACQTAYDRLALGKVFEQSIDGDKKSFTLRYIDWENIENNVFHVTEEFSVMRTGSKEHYRPDIVLFVNGIPLCIMRVNVPI
jgi:type I restriction enzyme R subunit